MIERAGLLTTLVLSLAVAAGAATVDGEALRREAEALAALGDRSPGTGL